MADLMTIEAVLSIFKNGIDLIKELYPSKTDDRLGALEREMKRLGDNFHQGLVLENDDGYNLFVRILRRTIENGTKERIRRFARIAHDVFYTENVSIARGGLYVDLIDRLTDQEVAFLLLLVKHWEGTDGKKTITQPTSEGMYEEEVIAVFEKIGIAKVEWGPVIKKLEVVGIFQFENSYVVGGRIYGLSEFGQAFVGFLKDESHT